MCGFREGGRKTGTCVVLGRYGGRQVYVWF